MIKYVSVWNLQNGYSDLNLGKKNIICSGSLLYYQQQDIMNADSHVLLQQ